MLCGFSYSGQLNTESHEGFSDTEVLWDHNGLIKHIQLIPVSSQIMLMTGEYLHKTIYRERLNKVDELQQKKNESIKTVSLNRNDKIITLSLLQEYNISSCVQHKVYRKHQDSLVCSVFQSRSNRNGK